MVESAMPQYCKLKKVTLVLTDQVNGKRYKFVGKLKEVSDYDTQN